MAERASGRAETLEIEVQGDGEEREVLLRGELDVVTSPKLRETVLSVIDEGGRHLVLDMSGLELIDSTGLGVLVGVLKRALQHGGDLRLRSPRSGARKVFDITGLDRVFTIID